MDKGENIINGLFYSHIIQWVHSAQNLSSDSKIIMFFLLDDATLQSNTYTCSYSLKANASNALIGYVNTMKRIIYKDIFRFQFIIEERKQDNFFNKILSDSTPRTF